MCEADNLPIENLLNMLILWITWQKVQWYSCSDNDIDLVIVSLCDPVFF